jgi:hypothetical protein
VNKISLKLIIGHLDIFLSISPSDVFGITELTLMLKTISQCDVTRYDVNDRNSDASFQGLNIHYYQNHSLSLQTRLQY